MRSSLIREIWKIGKNKQNLKINNQSKNEKLKKQKNIKKIISHIYNIL